MTDFGTAGNRYVAGAFAAYLKQRPVAAAPEHRTPTTRRVLITGFGLFDGAPFNISGLAVRAFVDPTAPASATILRRLISIDGVTFDVMGLVVDVVWDLAAAIIVEEARRFDPDFVFMTGRGGDDVIFEGGALNAGAPKCGYAVDGSALPLVTPVASANERSPLLPGVTLGHELPMTWDAVAVHRAAKPLIDKLGFASQALTTARVDNAYICNNVSYAALTAARGAMLTLAGGLITLAPRLSPKTKIGFLHLPKAARQDPNDLAVWAQVFERTIAAV